MKRTLALVLALVMAIGLMAFPVSADFTDDADIKYTEAVDVMSAIGVIDGFEDGSFDPDGYLTREQAAKVVAYLMLGAEDADALTASSAPFDDVAANRWSAGYIAYCVNEGIINGRSDTTFDPTGNVTGYEFAKLMLGCLGYDGAIEKYTGATWNINVAKTALTVGLFTGNKGANYNVPLTREEAALYAFNMIQADLVDYDNRGSEIDLGNGVTINTGASKAEPITTDTKSDTIKDEDTDGDRVWTVQFAERYFEDLEKNAGNTTDIFGRPSVNWEYDNEDIGTYSETADFTYTVAVTGDDLYDDLDPADDAEYTLDIDGVESYFKDIKDDDNVEFAVKNNNDVKLGGNGTLIEVYEDAKTDDLYHIVVINTYVAEISEWNEADEDNDEKESVDIDTLTAPAGNVDPNFETTKFDESDADDSTVVIYTAAEGDTAGEFEIQSVDVAEMVTATPTRVTTGKSFVAGGETYKYNTTCDTKVTSDDVKADDDLDIYLDSYGYVVYTTASGGDSNDYALVLGFEKSGEAFSDGDIAKLLLADGEIVVVDVDDDSNVTAGDKGEIVTYTVDRNGDYTLTQFVTNEEDGDYIHKGTTSSSNETYKVTKGSARVHLGDSGNVTANSKTVFFVLNKDVDDAKDADYDAYVGIANVPGLTNRDDTSTYFAIVDNNRLAAVFFTNAKAGSTNASDLIAVAFDKSETSQYDADFGDYYEYEVVNGDSVETMMFDASEVAAKFKSSDDCIYILSSITVDDEGVVTDVDVVDVDSNNEGVYEASKGTGRVSDGLITLGDDAFAYSDDCTVYKMNSDAEWTSSSINGIRNDDDDVATYVFDDDDGVVTAIYILVK